jgi:hypothetical protein
MHRCDFIATELWYSILWAECTLKIYHMELNLLLLEILHMLAFFRIGARTISYRYIVKMVLSMFAIIVFILDNGER